MNISKNFRILSVFAIAATFATASDAQQRAKLITADQPFVVFKAIKGAKNPLMFKCHPGVNELDIVYFGSQKKSGPTLVKTAQELENLVPLRYTMKFADIKAIEIDKKYAGYRDSYLGTGLENLFKLVGLYPAAGYKGTALVDEYKEGLPMKWVLSSAEHFKALKNYLTKGFNAANIQAQAVKPMLLLEIVEGHANLDASDYAFLTQYFDLLDPRDPTAKSFFDSANKFLNDIADKTQGAITVGAETGETILNQLDSDKELKGFDAKKILQEVLLLWALTETVKFAKTSFNDSVYDPVLKPAFKDFVGNYKDLGVKAAKVGGTVVASYLVYKIISDLIAQDDQDAEQAHDQATEAKEEAQA